MSLFLKWMTDKIRVRGATEQDDIGDLFTALHQSQLLLYNSNLEKRQAGQKSDSAILIGHRYASNTYRHTHTQHTHTYAKKTPYHFATVERRRRMEINPLNLIN